MACNISTIFRWLRLSAPYFSQRPRRAVTETGEQWVAAGDGKTLIGRQDASAAPSWSGTWQKGIPSLEWCNDINERLVEKVAINACINPLTAVHGVKNGALLSEPYLARAEQIIAEVENILTELGYAQLASRLTRQ